jgi:hypothetical protein
MPVTQEPALPTGEVVDILSARGQMVVSDLVLEVASRLPSGSKAIGNITTAHRAIRACESDGLINTSLDQSVVPARKMARLASTYRNKSR